VKLRADLTGESDERGDDDDVGEDDEDADGEDDNGLDERVQTNRYARPPVVHEE